MRYRIKGLEIRSENAARSFHQISGVLRDWLLAQSPVGSGLDYGCGKLRYASILVRRCGNLTLVDSGEQLRRHQRIGEMITSVTEYVKRWPRARVLTVEQFLRDSRTYDLALCANVLSTIPDRRARRAALRAIAASLAPGGRCLFVTQYRNSYFKAAAARPDAIPHLDGWITPAVGRRGSYYGIIHTAKLKGLVTNHGMDVVEAWSNDGSAYVVAVTRS